ncbi:HlyD family type I secretion periplasmic adaptor subunit [Novosphingobium mangrovi (ex Huang et al. 2023)]|uniref:Membrane fusion protein (MFP) family protein n=1 Tax=Novosphingobium mangrovi (ex Huang et al. 2023) TaxID=2976432 RepID=A0ABT2I1P6_9SPHN|nr:HlyD family type I secretion periplasmic adaptor subunit [Novosphingobium mangrovi (ex Huang et al. 2023)]MCT2398719.1 HlyD family type I secretion periplasmic adaptor subunit [Novosphingobium mangrovi (ex Huang et al. 2023)]
MNASMPFIKDRGGGSSAPMHGEFSARAERSLWWLVRSGLGAVAVLVLGIGGLIAFLPMAGAVIAPGDVTVETHVKEISHPFGGVASDILVRDGDRVKKGQVLVRLDSKVSGAMAEYAGLGLRQLLAKAARLRATLSGAPGVSFPDELARAAGDPAVLAAMEDERRSFVLARRARADQIGQLQARIAQARAEIATYASQSDAYDRQEQLVHEELAQTRQLYEQRLTTLDRLNALERAAVGVQAQRDTARAGMRQAHARIAELQVQMASVTSAARSEAALELAQVQAAISDLRKQDVAASDQNDRTAIRAPQDGIVDKLQVRTVGSVVPAGEPLMEIVPDADRLVVRARVRLTDIDSVATGQSAHLRFTALSMRTTPELNGTVTQVGADRTVDRVTNASYYSATVSIPDDEFRKLGNVRLSVGMPVEVFVQTQQRTILQYIIRPLSDQFKRALRE